MSGATGLRWNSAEMSFQGSTYNLKYELSTALLLVVIITVPVFMDAGE